MTVRCIETEWIELRDGTRLAARIWFPEDGITAPAILEYLPYRRRDRHRVDDSFTHPYFAKRGYAVVRVDMRGSGDSNGVMQDEYTEQEWHDALEVIAWIAKQPWCSGRVGMIGLSWSGFNALQIAAMRPLALKAIVTTCASDDRFADDMHYMGGCLLNDNLQYGSTLFTWLGAPPDPAIVGDRWRDMWKTRLEAITPPALRWMGHQERDAYWLSGSVCTDYSRIEAAVLAVGGWADGYTNAVMRLLTGLKGPRKGLIGPWGHAYPHVATPGPRIDFLAYVTRWWDHWLKDIDTNLMNEPMLTAWMQESEPPQPVYNERRGHWVAEPSWPSANVTNKEFHLGVGSLITSKEHEEPVAYVSSPPDLGTASGEWCPYGWGPDMPLDQRAEDAASAVFDTAPLAAPVQILGRISCQLRLHVDSSEAIIAVRVNDVSPDGVSRRITYGLLNLSHRDGHDHVAPIVPGKTLDATVMLKDAGYQVPAGHRIRLAVSTSYWPLAVGVPRKIAMTIASGSLALPLREKATPFEPGFGEPVAPPYPEMSEVSPPARGRLRITRDLAARVTHVDVVRNLGAVHLADVDLTLHAMGSETYSMPWDDPAGATSTASRKAAFKRDGWDCELRTDSVLSFSGDDYVFDGRLEAFENGVAILERRWSERVPRSAAAASARHSQPQLGGKTSPDNHKTSNRE